MCQRWHLVAGTPGDSGKDRVCRRSRGDVAPGYRRAESGARPRGKAWRKGGTERRLWARGRLWAPRGTRWPRRPRGSRARQGGRKPRRCPARLAFCSARRALFLPGLQRKRGQRCFFSSATCPASGTSPRGVLRADGSGTVSVSPGPCPARASSVPSRLAARLCCETQQQEQHSKPAN